MFDKAYVGNSLKREYEILILSYFRKMSGFCKKISTFVGYGGRKDMEIA